MARKNSKKLTVAQVQEVIESEGLEYAVLSYLLADKIANHDLSDLWTKAKEALEEIQSFIEDHSFEVERDNNDSNDENDDDEDEDY